MAQGEGVEDGLHLTRRTPQMPPTPPLSPTEIDELLKPDLRTLNADLLALRDGLDRMTSALWRLAAALGSAPTATRHAGRPD